MRIIDFHTHTFPEKIAERTIEGLSHKSRTMPFSDGTEAGLIEKMKKAGIERSVVLPVATTSKQVEKVNDASARLNEERAVDGLYSFGCMHPDYEGYRKELARIKALGFKGIKLHPVYQGVALDDIRNLNVIDRAAELGLAVVTHTGYDVGYPGVDLCSPKRARHVIDTIGEFPFVLAHMGGWMQWDEVPEYLADTSCYLDTAFSTGKMTPRKEVGELHFPVQMLDKEEFLKLLSIFGSKRILFGTDSPWSDAATEIAFIENLPISEEEKRDIFYNNAQEIL